MPRFQGFLSSCALVLAFGLTAQSAIAVPAKRIGVPNAVKEDETLELADGVKVSAKQYADEVNQLQEAIERDGFSIRKSDNLRPTKKIWAFAGAEKERDDDKAAFTGKVGKLRANQAAGFKHMLKARGAKIDPSATGKGGDGKSGGNTRPPSAQAQDLAEEPLSTTYEEALGNKDRAAIYVNFGLEDTGDKDSVGCSASMEGGVYLFKGKVALAKVALSGSVSNTTAKGATEIYLLGKMVDGFPKSGSATLPKVSKSISPPDIGYTYGWNPISIAITAGVAGELGFDLSNRQEKASGGHKGKCTVGVTPYVRGSGKVTASVSALAYKVGVEGKITLIDLKVPATATVSIQSSPLTLREDFDAKIDASFLDGGFSFFVKSNIPKKGEKLWDIDWDTIYSKTLFEWDGMKAKETLAHFEAKQTPFK